MSIDPRAKSPERLVAPAPLPHVSRRALARVKNPLPVPTECRYCAGQVKLINNSKIYGREYGDWPFMYRCEDCHAYVGLHPNTDVPLGTVATHQLRKDRMASKDLFHKVKHAKGLSRTLAYQWLAGKLDIPVEQCHFGWFEQDDCVRVVGICVEELTGNTAMGRAFQAARKAS